MEDKIFIEVKQKLLQSSPDFRPQFFSEDEAFSHFRMRLKAALDAEDKANLLAVCDAIIPP